jgi:hypothetical protein
MFNIRSDFYYIRVFTMMFMMAEKRGKLEYAGRLFAPPFCDPVSFPRGKEAVSPVTSDCAIQLKRLPVWSPLPLPARPPSKTEPASLGFCFAFIGSVPRSLPLDPLPPAKKGPAGPLV